jgi:hypothetical protein
MRVAIYRLWFLLSCWQVIFYGVIGTGFILKHTTTGYILRVALLLVYRSSNCSIGVAESTTGKTVSFEPGLATQQGE